MTNVVKKTKPEDGTGRMAQGGWHREDGTGRDGTGRMAQGGMAQGGWHGEG